jgi:hypothetical protein
MEVSPKTCLKCSIFVHLVDNALDAMLLIPSVPVTVLTLYEHSNPVYTSELYYTIFIPHHPPPPSNTSDPKLTLFTSFKE